MENPLRILERSFAVIVVLTAFSQAGAQRTFTLATDSGRWEPFAPLGSHGQLTVAQERVMNDHARAVMDLFRTAAPLNPPHGFLVAPGGALCDDHSCPSGAPATAHLTVLLHPFLRDVRTGAISQAGLKYDGMSIDVALNQIRVDWRPYDIENQLFVEPAITGRVAGYPVFEHRYLVVTKNPRPIYIPLSQGEYISGFIARERTLLGDTRSTIAKGSALEQWLANRKAATEGFMQGNAIVARTDPAKARQQREEFERGMDETERSLRAQDGANRGALTGAAADASSRIQALDAELAGLSPSERAAPAYLPTGRNSTTRASGLSARPDGANTQMLIRPNPAFFDRKLPRTAIQVITIDLGGMRDDDPRDASDSTRVAARNALDYARLSRLLDQGK